VLTAYENATLQLFQALTSPVPLIPLSVIDGYINTARNQVAAEGECVRPGATLTLVNGTRAYNFSAMVPVDANIASVLAVRSAVIIGSGSIDIRPFEWFAAYYLSDATTVGLPRIAAQREQGAAGVVWLWPTPNSTAQIQFDAACLPIPLVDNTTPEALPYPWTDAVPFYAAWLAMMNAQRQADADAMFGRYEQVMMRLARMGATPSELPSSMPTDRGLAMQRTG